MRFLPHPLHWVVAVALRAFAHAFCTVASRVAKSGGSRWQPSATLYFFLFVAHPCGGSVATTRVAVVLRRVPRLFLYLFFSFCTARSSLASVPPGGLCRFASASRS